VEVCFEDPREGEREVSVRKGRCPNILMAVWFMIDEVFCSLRMSGSSKAHLNDNTVINVTLYFLIVGFTDFVLRAVVLSRS
jgi:hypothetical protein